MPTARLVRDGERDAELELCTKDLHFNYPPFIKGKKKMSEKLPSPRESDKGTEEESLPTAH